ncbi:DUF4351 domain-containing protein [Gloeocapsopsis crepidinum]
MRQLTKKLGKSDKSMRERVSTFSFEQLELLGEALLTSVRDKKRRGQVS